jgi:hypothetical protein
MPNVGDTIAGKVLGKPGNRYIWAQCDTCGNQRWAQYSSYNPNSIRRCKPCHIQHIRGRFRLRGSNV